MSFRTKRSGVKNDKYVKYEINCIIEGFVFSL